MSSSLFYSRLQRVWNVSYLLKLVGISHKALKCQNNLSEAMAFFYWEWMYVERSGMHIIDGKPLKRLFKMTRRLSRYSCEISHFESRFLCKTGKTTCNLPWRWAGSPLAAWAAMWLAGWLSEPVWWRESGSRWKPGSRRCGWMKKKKKNTPENHF